MADGDFDIPSGLSKKGREAAKAFVQFLKERGRLNSGGCKVFYSPKEWRERGELYGRDSLLIICHDGGDHAAAVNLDYEQYKLNDELIQHFDKHGVWVESCTCWYAAVYSH